MRHSLRFPVGMVEGYPKSRIGGISCMCALFTKMAVLNLYYLDFRLFSYSDVRTQTFTSVTWSANNALSPDHFAPSQPESYERTNYHLWVVLVQTPSLSNHAVESVLPLIIREGKRFFSISQIFYFSESRDFGSQVLLPKLEDQSRYFIHLFIFSFYQAIYAYTKMVKIAKTQNTKLLLNRSKSKLSLRPR